MYSVFWYEFSIKTRKSFWFRRKIEGGTNGNFFEERKGIQELAEIGIQGFSFFNVIGNWEEGFTFEYELFDVNEKKYIFDPHVVNDYSDFQFISSWERNYKSWKYQKEFPVKIVKYENLIDDINLCFFEIIKFINKITNNKEPIDLKKMNNSINSTSFKKLKEIEKNKGFLESVKSKKKNSQIPFFNMGPKNDWKKILSEDLNGICTSNLCIFLSVSVDHASKGATFF